MGEEKPSRLRNGKPLRSCFWRVCDPLPIRIGIVFGIGIGFGSPKAHPWATHAPRKGHTQGSNCGSALFTTSVEK